MRRFLIVLVLCLSGCASSGIVKVPVPVISPHPVKLPAQPDLPIRHLTEKSTPDVVAEAYAASIQALLDHIHNIETVCGAR
jgi:hypothetical protein